MNIYSFTIEQEMSMAPPVASAPVITTGEQRCIEQCSTSPSSIDSNIKQEKHDELLKCEKLSSRQQQTPNTPIAFSITNILSNTFGTATTKLPTNNNNQINRNNNNNKVISEKKNSVLFRPYDDDCGGEHGGASSPSPTKHDRRQQQQSDDEESNGELNGSIFNLNHFFICFFYGCWNKIDFF